MYNPKIGPLQSMWAWMPKEPNFLVLWPPKIRVLLEEMQPRKAAEPTAIGKTTYNPDLNGGKVDHISGKVAAKLHPKG